VLREHKSAVLMSMALTWLLSAAIVVVILMTPAYLQKQLGLAAAVTLKANSIATVALTIGCILAGRIIDSLGAGWAFIAGSSLLGGVVWHFYNGVLADPSTLYLNYALAGLAVGIVGAVPYVMVNAFPAVVRFTGLSFSYNVAYAIFGGLTPLMVSLWLKPNASPPPTTSATSACSVC
jgi:hypothetical protein